MVRCQMNDQNEATKMIYAMETPQNTATRQSGPQRTSEVFSWILKNSTRSFLSTPGTVNTHWKHLHSCKDAPRPPCMTDSLPACYFTIQFFCPLGSPWHLLKLCSLSFTHPHLLPFPTSVLIYGLSLNWTLVKTEMISITHE